MKEKNNYSIYLAYGSNLDLTQMNYRCPDAVPLGTAWIEGYRLMHKGSKTGAYATIEPDNKCRVPVLVWCISHSDEKSLDYYEGCPTFYYKRDLPITGFKSVYGGHGENPPTSGMVYIMHEERKFGIPSQHYIDVLYHSYLDLNFPMDILVDSIRYTGDMIKAC